MTKFEKWLTKVGKPAIITGALVILSGAKFHLQGRAVVGPESSFMYANPQWINGRERLYSVNQKTIKPLMKMMQDHINKFCAKRCKK